MELLKECRLTSGVRREGELLVVPPEGGGLVLPDLSETEYRWINVTLSVEEDHAQAFEFRFYAEGDQPPRVVASAPRRSSATVHGSAGRKSAGRNSWRCPLHGRCMYALKPWSRRMNRRRPCRCRKRR